MTRVFIYARYSSDNQKETSIEDQIRISKERAKREGWEIVEIFTDYALSASSMMLRSGIQALMQAAMRGEVDLILCESLDRISRDQEDIAGIFKRLKYVGVEMFTLAEGQITELHIGFKGTMNALYLKDLKDKVKRGQRGRIENGKNGGGNCYGYDIVRKFDERGEPIRGDRKINPYQATIVQRIFTEYAQGKSPKAIASALNREGVPSPSGKGWGASTINGNWQRGTGMLNNELYIGELVWNRVSYPKNPDTAKKVSRINPESEWIRHPVPDLRIIDQELWDKVKAKQRRLRHSMPNFWQAKRPTYLFTGILKCGICGGSYAKISQHHYGCSAARNKGSAICDNLRSIRQDKLEYTVLSVLRDRLMAPELLAEFCEEYTAHLNRLRMERNASLEGYKSEYARLDAREIRMVKAIGDGYASARLKEEMDELLARKAELERLIASTDDAPVLLHPNMSERYRQEVTRLINALNDDKSRSEAVTLIRSLIDYIVITPDRLQGESVVDVHGDLAGILNIAADKKHKEDNELDLRQIRLVAGLSPRHDIKTAGKGGGGGGLNFRPASHNDLGRNDLSLPGFNPMQDQVVEPRGIEPLTS